MYQLKHKLIQDYKKEAYSAKFRKFQNLNVEEQRMVTPEKSYKFQSQIENPLSQPLLSSQNYIFKSNKKSYLQDLDTDRKTHSQARNIIRNYQIRKKLNIRKRENYRRLSQGAQRNKKLINSLSSLKSHRIFKTETKYLVNSKRKQSFTERYKTQKRRHTKHNISQRIQKKTPISIRYKTPQYQRIINKQKKQKEKKQQTNSISLKIKLASTNKVYSIYSQQFLQDLSKAKSQLRYFQNQISRIVISNTSQYYPTNLKQNLVLDSQEQIMLFAAYEKVVKKLEQIQRTLNEEMLSQRLTQRTHHETLQSTRQSENDVGLLEYLKFINNDQLIRSKRDIFDDMQKLYDNIKDKQLEIDQLQNLIKAKDDIIKRVDLDNKETKIHARELKKSFLKQSKDLKTSREQVIQLQQEKQELLKYIDDNFETDSKIKKIVSVERENKQLKFNQQALTSQFTQSQQQNQKQLEILELINKNLNSQLKEKEQQLKRQSATIIFQDIKKQTSSNQLILQKTISELKIKNQMLEEIKQKNDELTNLLKLSNFQNVIQEKRIENNMSKKQNAKNQLLEYIDKMKKQMPEKGFQNIYNELKRRFQQQSEANIKEVRQLYSQIARQRNQIRNLRQYNNELQQKIQSFKIDMENLKLEQKKIDQSFQQQNQNNISLQDQTLVNILKNISKVLNVKDNKITSHNDVYKLYEDVVLMKREHQNKVTEINKLIQITSSKQTHSNSQYFLKLLEQNFLKLDIETSRNIKQFLPQRLDVKLDVIIKNLFENLNKDIQEIKKENYNLRMNEEQTKLDSERQVQEEINRVRKNLNDYEQLLKCQQIKLQEQQTIILQQKSNQEDQRYQEDQLKGQLFKLKESYEIIKMKYTHEVEEQAKLQSNEVQQLIEAISELQLNQTNFEYFINYYKQFIFKQISLSLNVYFHSIDVYKLLENLYETCDKIINYKSQRMKINNCLDKTIKVEDKAKFEQELISLEQKINNLKTTKYQTEGEIDKLKKEEKRKYIQQLLKDKLIIRTNSRINEQIMTEPDKYKPDLLRTTGLKLNNYTSIDYFPKNKQSNSSNTEKSSFIKDDIDNFN